MGTVDPIAGGGAKADKLAPGDQPKADTLHPDEFTRGSEVSTRASVNQLNSNAFNIGFFKSDPTWKPVGVTGSSRVTGEDGAKYQLKKSISHIGEFFSGFLRRFKAWWSNRENMGEFISSTVSRFIDPKKAPEVSIVTNPEQNQVFIASKYFQKRITWVVLRRLLHLII
ncbi:MAG: hypothetical protein JKY15_00515 [Deltaproteobacteria bacterium]|nr:hypothetical protein [Deltaproteobacteria bacterium]